MNYKLAKTIEDIKNYQIDKNQLVCLLENYYQKVIYLIDEKTDDEIYEEENKSFPEELTLPLEKRESGILEALSIVLSINPNVNEDDGFSNALMISVGNMDAFLTEYLLEHGFDSGLWPDTEDDEQNYYLEDIDIHYMYYCLENNNDKKYEESLFKTALVLVKKGNLLNFQGNCLTINDGKIIFTPCKAMF